MPRASVKTSWIFRFSSAALARSWPNGFSRTIRAFSAMPSSAMRSTIPGYATGGVAA